MKALRKQVDKFCYRHPNFGIPKLMLILCIGTALVYLISLMDTTGTFQTFLYFYPSKILHGEIWRLISWLILPDASSLWLLIALYFYYFIGNTLEGAWGAGRFTAFYFLGVIFNVIMGFAVYFIGHVTILLDPYYLNMSMFFAFATLFPEQRVLFLFFIPIKVKWLAIVDAVMIFLPAIVRAVTGSWLVALLPLTAIINYLVFCGNDLLTAFNRTGSRASHMGRTIEFKQAARQVKRETAAAEKAGYRHECSVCGRTDTDNPNLEFRYCSRCVGYHCFCSDHINSHVHFTE